MWKKPPGLSSFSQFPGAQATIPAQTTIYGIVVDIIFQYVRFFKKPTESFPHNPQGYPQLSPGKTGKFLQKSVFPPEKAKKFCEQILKISNYYVEIVPILEDKKEE